MELVGVTKRTVAVLLALIVMVGVVAIPPAGAVTDIFQRHGGDLNVYATWHKPAGYTTCKVSDIRGQTWRRYEFNRSGKLDARDCYNYWSSHGHPGLRGGKK
jgi:hypothetical protein